MEWIDIKDRLPESFTHVLAYIQPCFYYVVYLDTNKNRWREGGVGGMEFELNKLSHWMPLPEPPKENS
jgi:hypothetical protein